MSEFEEVDVFGAGKRCGIQYCPWMGDWFTSWSPRNQNSNAEGQWSHWVNLAAFILSHKATQIVAPEKYRPELKFDPHLYTGGATLTKEQIQELFFDGTQTDSAAALESSTNNEVTNNEVTNT